MKETLQFKKSSGLEPQGYQAAPAPLPSTIRLAALIKQIKPGPVAVPIYYFIM